MTRLAKAVAFGPVTAAKLRRIADTQYRDLVADRRRIDVASSPTWLLPARITAVSGAVNATYSAKAEIGDLEIENVAPHDRCFHAPPAEFEPVAVGAPCFIARFPSPGGDEDEYYLWSLHEKCKTAICGGSP